MFGRLCEHSWVSPLVCAQFIHPTPCSCLGGGGGPPPPSWAQLEQINPPSLPGGWSGGSLPCTQTHTERQRPPFHGPAAGKQPNQKLSSVGWIPANLTHRQCAPHSTSPLRTRSHIRT